jgi:hypoxanthine phosphoribosyltransferase
MSQETITTQSHKYQEVNGYSIEELISEQAIHQRIIKMADQIYTDYEGQDLTLVCILNGAESFFNSLKKELGRGNSDVNRKPISVREGYLGLSSYKDGHVSSGKIDVTMALNICITGRNVLVVEDIVDSGHTIEQSKPIFEAKEPASLKYCVLLDKSENREVDVKVDYTGFVIPNKYVVGFGLDDGGEFRNLPYVGVVVSKPFSPVLST